MKAFSRTILSLFLVGMLVFTSSLDFTFSPAQASETTVIRVSPLYIEMLQNTLFNVSILIDNVPEDPGVAGVEFKLTWNSSILNGVSMEEVLFSDIPLGEEDNIWQLKHEFSAGQVWYAYTYLDQSRAIEGGYLPKSGNGTLAIITFNSIAPGETDLHFSQSIIGDLYANPVSHDAVDGTVRARAPVTLLTNLEYPTSLWVKGDKVYLTETAGRNTVWGGKICLDQYDVVTGEKSVLIDNPLCSDAVVVASDGKIYLTSYLNCSPGEQGMVSVVDPLTGVETHFLDIEIASADMFIDSNDDIFIIGLSDQPGAKSIYLLPSGDYANPTVLKTGLGRAACISKSNSYIYYGHCFEPIKRFSYPSGPIETFVNKSKVLSVSLSSAYLYYADYLGGTVGRINIQTKADETVVSSLNRPICVRFDQASNRLYFLEAGTDAAQGKDGTLKFIAEIQDDEPPLVENVRHEPLYPMSTEEIFFYADVTDNVAVATVQLNYTLDGGATWLLKDIPLLDETTYSTSLGPYPQFQIIGFCVVAYDTSGNKAIGSEIVPPLPEPPRVAAIVVSDEPPNPLPDGEDVGYNVTETGVEVYVNTTELGLGPGPYAIIYSLDGGITWIQGGMTYIGGFVWSHVIPAFTNILFRVEASDGSYSMIYWIIIAPWKYSIYLYFSTEEQYYPVKGLDFDYDYEQTGNHDIANNKESYDTYFASYRPVDLDDDDFPDVPAYAYMNPKMLDDGCLVIEYWIYYAFNDYFHFDKHEHDFESIYLWIDIATGNIKKIALSQHTWVNHYFLNVPRTRRINIAVELGGHGMQLLADSDGNGLPDEGLLGEYVRARPYEYPILTLPMMDHWWTINKDSFVAQLFPWTIFDLRLPQNELHLFGDPTILTVGLATFFPFPHLMQDPSGSLDETETQDIYAYVLDLIGSPTLLKTDYALTLPVPDGALAFLVSAPWYRKEFTEPRLEWNKADFRFWLGRLVGKVALKIVIHYITGGMFAAVETAIARGILEFAAGWSLNYIINWLIDPVSGSVIDEFDNVLGYVDGDIVFEVPGSYIFATRSMTYDLYDLFFVLTSSAEGYIYEVRGIDTLDTYNFTVSCLDANGNELSFNATEILILAGEIHRYAVNWTMLENEALCAEVYVDQDGDGTFEHEFLSDSELTGNEFELAIAACILDLDQDGFVGVSDISLAAVAFGSFPGHPRWNPVADLNKDGWVDISDIAKIAVNFGKIV